MSFFMNKVFGAILGTLLFGFFVIEVSHHLYPNPNGHDEHAEAMGYPVPGMEAGHGGDDATDAPAEPDLPTLLASADVAAGEAQFRACASCHNDAPGASAMVGPNLWGVVGRPVAQEAGFNYSGALSAHGGNWTFEELFHFLENPRGYIAGTNMAYAGMRRATARADLIAYLNSRSENPMPLPAVTAAPVEDAMDTVEGAMEDHAPAEEGGH